MKTHIFYFDGNEIEVEVVNPVTLECSASVWKSPEELLEVTFYLSDINAENKGSYMTWDYKTEAPKEVQFSYDPFANYFEYCINELEYYLINVALWKKAKL